MKITNSIQGGKYYGDTSNHTPEGVAGSAWGVIQVIADAKFHTLKGTVAGIANTTSGSAPTIPAGTVVEGVFSELQLHGGAIIVYYA